MTQRQIDSLNMFNAVLQYLSDNSADWNTNTLISSGAKAFSTSVDAIHKLSATQLSSEKKGYTTKKDQDLENLVNLTFKLALRVKNYAVSINDAVLKQAVDFSHHELEAGKETDVVNRCSNIADKANSIVAAAPPEYKITADLITQVTNAAAAIEPDRSERDVVGGTHSGATMQLNNLFATARTNLYTLDDLIEGDADDDSSDFVRNYFIMRRTVDHKGGGGKKDDGKDGNAPKA